jgi:hypothetical protein
VPPLIQDAQSFFECACRGAVVARQRAAHKTMTMAIYVGCVACPTNVDCGTSASGIDDNKKLIDLSNVLQTV